MCAQQRCTEMHFAVKVILLIFFVIAEGAMDGLSSDKYWQISCLLYDIV